MRVPADILQEKMYMNRNTCTEGLKRTQRAKLPILYVIDIMKYN